MYEKLRASREVLENLPTQGLNPDLTVFLGLYNAAPYLDSLEHQLASQGNDFRLLVVDNQSVDSTWADIQRWSELFSGRITLVRNPINLGGSGSLYMNSDLITTTWFATLHQDDHYLPNHVSTLAKAISGCSSNILCISTEMGSLDSLGVKKGSPPRASWFLPDTDPATIFLSNLRLHNVPYPAAAFRKDAFIDYAVPWESTAFPDTEWVLKVSGLGQFLFLQVETMLYRENPTSESHSLNSEEKSLGASMSLLRVFGADTFVELCGSIGLANRSAFAKSLLDGLDLRLKAGPLVDDVKLFALQKMAFAWGYEDTYSNSQLALHYEKIGSAFSSTLLRSMNNFIDHESGTKLHPGQPTHKPHDEKITVKCHQFPKALFLGFYGALPVVLRRLIGKLARRVIGRSKRNSPWNFHWK